MSARPPLTLAIVSVLAAVGCSGTADAPVGPAPVQAVEPTDPVPPGDTHAPLTASPSCASPGSRVVLRLGKTSDGRIPSCLRLEDFRVRFGQIKTVITAVGLNAEGYCALDVIVPENATTGTARVLTEQDTYETTDVFPIPCQ